MKFSLLRAGQVVHCKFAFEADGGSWATSLTNDRGNNFDAALYIEKLKAEMARWKQDIIKEAYQRGFTDANRAPAARRGPPLAGQF